MGRGYLRPVGQAHTFLVLSFGLQVGSESFFATRTFCFWRLVGKGEVGLGHYCTVNPKPLLSLLLGAPTSNCSERGPNVLEDSFVNGNSRGVI